MIDPPFVHHSEAALTEHAVPPEVPSGCPELLEGEAPDVGRVENLALTPRG